MIIITVTWLEDVDDGGCRVVGGEAVPQPARVPEPLFHVAVVSSCVSRTCSLNVETVNVKCRALELQS